MMIFPSGGVPERGLDWFFVATEACDGGTSDLGSPRGFLEYLGIYRAEKGCGRPPRWAQPTWARPGGLCPLGAPPGAALALWMSSGPQKIHKKFRSVWTPFDIDFMRCKKQAKTATGTGHWVNRLVPKK